MFELHHLSRPQVEEIRELAARSVTSNAPEVRLAAARVLAKFGDSASIPVLQKAVDAEQDQFSRPRMLDALKLLEERQSGSADGKKPPLAGEKMLVNSRKNAMTAPTHLAGVGLLCIAAVGLLPAPIAGTRSLDELVADSDSIVVGSVVQGKAAGTSVTVSVQVERSLKGNLATGAVLTATGIVGAPSPTRAISRERGIFFLANAGTGPMRLVPVTSGFVLDERFLFVPLPDASSPAAAPSASSSVRDRVLLEILGGVAAGPLKQPGGFIDPESEYRVNPTPLVRSAFQAWLTSDSPELVASAMQALLPEGNPTALSGLAGDAAMRSSAPPGTFNGLKWYFASTDPAAVGLLGQFVADTTNSLDLRVAAASALARVHTRQALLFLAGLLDDPDLDLRRCAVGGLSMFANNVPIGSHEPAAGAWPWRTDETIAHSAMDAANAGFWKSWWAANQSALSQ